MTANPSIGRDAVLAARDRLGDAVVTTPLVAARIAGVRIHLKAECLQQGGAFKLRGASNRLLAMSAAERALGVVAFSSGNHAQGVAIAARRLGMAATIVMPSDAPAPKVEGTRREGAAIVFYDRRTESREAIAAALAAESGAIVVPSFDDPWIVAGQGTAGLEIADQLGFEPPAIVTPCGGGGLAAGLALACPSAAITIVEPDGWDDMGRSLDGGPMQAVGPDAPATLCDALQTPKAATLTRDILAARGARAVSVSDAAVMAAMRWAHAKHGLTVEPGGAAALAAVLAGKVAPVDDMVVMLSGGNVDPALMARVLAG